MPAKLTTIISFPTNKDGHLTKRVRDFGEDLWREIESRGLGNVGGLKTVDAAVDKLIVHADANKLVGQVRKRVEALLKQHLLHKLAAITYN